MLERKTLTGLAIAAALTCAAGVAGAEQLSPMAGRTVTLAEARGVVFYTAEKDGYRLVATFVAAPGARPIRFVTTLAPEQRTTISVPQGVGEPAIEVTFARQGDRMVVNDSRNTPAVVADRRSAGE